MDSIAAPAHHNIGVIAMYRGDWTVARRHFFTSLELAEKLGDRAGMSRRKLSLAICQYWSGDWGKASLSARDAMEDARHPRRFKSS
jgi:hypothetical protein